MRLLVLLSALAALVALLPSGCKKSKSGEAEEPPAVTGQRVCDVFLVNYERCIEDNIPDQDQPAHKKAFDAHKAAWVRAATTPGGKAALVATCRQVTEHVRETTQSYGCKY